MHLFRELVMFWIIRTSPNFQVSEEPKIIYLKHSWHNKKIAYNEMILLWDKLLTEKMVDWFTLCLKLTHLVDKLLIHRFMLKGMCLILSECVIGNDSCIAQNLNQIKPSSDLDPLQLLASKSWLWNIIVPLWGMWLESVACSWFLCRSHSYLSLAMKKLYFRVYF